ncbi:S16 family serine protease [Polyangium jinanense]|uniref:endopeptidase La n=1 Tax=Polyangium jinanense TaxID=2829994 RepID=A0A9X4APJ4_9BACT|nr:S16 family serine protease [Polyangium jinanense]MDC3952491.1 AAA family ATPase [Polyangium jinanense]MDC3980119.1 AAA family ATPase [Polyangium jinanense]
MARTQLPLVGLLEEAILPGEERTFAVPAIDTVALVALSRVARDGKLPAEILAVTITSSVELPSLVTGRWGTTCRIVSVDAASLTLAGLRRGRLVAARGKEPPYTADVDTPDEDEPTPDTKALLSAAHLLFAALDEGAVPEPLDFHAPLRTALAAATRAVSGKSELAELTQHPLEEGIRRVALLLASRAEGRHAASELEAMLRQAMAKPEVPKALRQKLWSQIVELQKRLDLHDPAIAEEGDDLARLQRKLSQAGMPKLARETAKRELRLLRGMQSNHHDYSTYTNHLDFMARLPWQPDPERPIDLAAVRAALDRGHHGLEKPKRRVAEYLAVRKLGGENASMILCLAGPPGVGKTTIARAMAEALGRPFARVALGGVHDESEIRGHRLSYVAASAGRILRAIAEAGSASALVLLDEIDKIGEGRARSPMAALLEVLDPEQNPHFQDNFLGVPYDLSHVLFVATANDTSQIHPTLLDRLELCEIEGYTAVEKTMILRTHLLDRLRAEIGLPKTPAIEDDAVMALIDGYTREAGVRQLRHTLATVLRARALALVTRREQGEADAAGEEQAPPITQAEVEAVLGPPRFTKAKALGALPIGVTTGLSVGPGGGSVLFVEAATMAGRGELVSTGNLGDVLKESVRAAFSHVRAETSRYGVEPGRLAATDVHVHVPEASLAKDGPSAGTAIFAALVSALSGRPAPADTALTGELSLSGRVLAVGGIRAKLIAAERAGLARVVIPEANRADVPEDIHLDVTFVRTIDEVYRALFPS